MNHTPDSRSPRTDDTQTSRLQTYVPPQITDLGAFAEPNITGSGPCGCGEGTCGAIVFCGTCGSCGSCLFCGP